MRLPRVWAKIWILGFATGAALAIGTVLALSESGFASTKRPHRHYRHHRHRGHHAGSGSSRKATPEIQDHTAKLITQAYDAWLFLHPHKIDSETDRKKARETYYTLFDTIGIESTLNPKSVGDHGLATTVAQFHPGTWTTYAKDFYAEYRNLRDANVTKPDRSQWKPIADWSAHCGTVDRKGGFHPYSTKTLNSWNNDWSVLCPAFSLIDHVADDNAYAWTGWKKAEHLRGLRPSRGDKGNMAVAKRFADKYDDTLVALNGLSRKRSGALTGEKADNSIDSASTLASRYANRPIELVDNVGGRNTALDYPAGSIYH